MATNVTAIAAGESHSLFLKSEGSLWAMGDNQYSALGDGTLNDTNRTEQILGPYLSHKQLLAYPFRAVAPPVC